MRVTQEKRENQPLRIKIEIKIEPIEVAGRVLAVAGDITLPGLGLSHEDERFHFFTWMQKSKHLKGQLDPPVSNGHVFWTKGGQLAFPVSDVAFLHQWRSVGPHCE